MKHLLALVLTAASFGAMAQSSTSQSASQSGAQAGSSSGAASIIYLDQSVRSVDQTTKGTMESTNHDTVTYGGRLENVQSGTTTNNIVHSGGVTDTTNVNYSGTQTIKNVPGIAMSGPASGPCTGASGGLGLAGPGFGIGLNGAKVEPSCVLRENIRITGMAMQSLDGAANPQEKGQLMVMMMDQMRGLAELSKQIITDNVKAK